MRSYLELTALRGRETQLHAEVLQGDLVYAIRPPGSLTTAHAAAVAEVLLAPVTRFGFGDKEPRHSWPDAPAGAVILTRGSKEIRTSWASERESVTILLGPGELERLAFDEFGATSLELRPPDIESVDESALQIAQLIRDDLTRAEPTGNLYRQSLVTALLAHLLRSYSNATGKAETWTAGGLSPSSARRVREYIETNLGSKVSVAEMAKVAGLSESGFIRGFQVSFGRSPHQYLLSRRIQKAEQLLVETNMALPEIAERVGFSSQSHFTTMMKRYRSMTPRQIRQRS